MFGKNWQTRWDDTIAYLNQKFPADRLSDHIESVVPRNQRKSISGQIAPGRRSAGGTTLTSTTAPPSLGSSTRCRCRIGSERMRGGYRWRSMAHPDAQT